MVNREVFEKLRKISASEEDIEKVISSFSFFLSVTNDAYYYNETYLPQFCEEFFEFKKYIVLKYDFFTRLSAVLCLIHFEIHEPVYMCIDDYFTYDLKGDIKDNNYKFSPKVDKRKICQDKAVCKCWYINGNKKREMRLEIECIRNGQLIEEEVTKTQQFVKKFLEEGGVIK